MLQLKVVNRNDAYILYPASFSYNEPYIFIGLIQTKIDFYYRSPAQVEYRNPFSNIGDETDVNCLLCMRLMHFI
jgi:hypothetical protein